MKTTFIKFKIKKGIWFIYLTSWADVCGYNSGKASSYINNLTKQDKLFLNSSTHSIQTSKQNTHFYYTNLLLPLIFFPFPLLKSNHHAQEHAHTCNSYPPPPHLKNTTFPFCSKLNTLA